MISALFLAAALLTAAPPGDEADALPSPPVPAVGGVDIDEGYRAQFDQCDLDNSFYGESFTGWQGCRGDPNRALLRRLSDGAVAYMSKLAVDLDGSPFACGDDHGATDQCGTALELTGAEGAPVPLDADQIPYVVIPQAGPAEHRGEFSRLTGVHVGDFGVVVYDDVVVPVIVGDTGPYNKLGEGSLALHRALGRELCVQRDAAGTCLSVVPRMRSIDDHVLTVLFPGTARKDLTPQTLAAVIQAEGERLWARHQGLEAAR